MTMSESQDIEELRERVERLEEHVDTDRESIDLVETGLGGLDDEYFTITGESIKAVRAAIGFVDTATDGCGAAEELVIEVLCVIGFARGHSEKYINRLRRHGEIYNPDDEVVKIV